MSDASAADLRSRAEARLTERSLEPATGEASLQRLVHELRVHQIELEIQNEDLAAVRDRSDSANQLLRKTNAELSALNQMMVGRELTMVALKQQVNALCRELGREPPYPVGFPPDTANIHACFSGDWQ